MGLANIIASGQTRVNSVKSELKYVHHFRYRAMQYSRAYCTVIANVSTESETTPGNHFETIHKTTPMV